MENDLVIRKQRILDAAFDIARRKGLSGLVIREVARTCDVAVGTVYACYPTKSELMNDVVGRFWNESLAERLPCAEAGDDFVRFCGDLAAQTARAIERYHDDWLAEVSMLDAHDLAASCRREEAVLSRIRESLTAAIARDPLIDRSRLTGPLSPEALSAFTWNSMLASIKRGDPSCETLLALLRATLY